MNSPHLTADELDGLLDQQISPRVTSHLATCAECASMVERDRRVVQALAALPYYDAAPDFGDRVIRGITPRQAPAAVVVAERSPRAVAARRRAIGALVLAGGGLAAGFAWAATHPGEALRWSGPALQDSGHAVWQSLQSVVANATEQPWFPSVRDALATPVRALLAFAGITGCYAFALTGLRRLMTEPATDAGW